MNLTKKQIVPVVGSTSLVGIYAKEYPFRFGNYFTFHNGPRCLNMWVENLQEWLTRNSDVKTIEVTCWGERGNDPYFNRELCVVTDARIPRDWLLDRLCFTGCMMEVPVSAMKALTEACGATLSKDMFCGCENPEENSSITQIGRPDENGKWVHMAICERCGRKWENSREPYVDESS